MDRRLEPELMDDAAQALAYAEADFEEPNRQFVELYLDRFGAAPAAGAVLDLGCGPGDITLRLAGALPGVEVHGLDGAASMLTLAEEARRVAGAAGDRVRFVQGLVPGADLPRSRYDAVVSNSLLHHLHEPDGLWQVIRDAAAPGAPVLVMDLMRPDSEAAARAIVDQYASDEPDVLRTDFYNSLLAAFEPDEVRAQLDEAGLGGLRVEEASDRHLIVWGRT